MLILSRKEGEKILIGESIVVMVTGFKNGPTVSLGIEAPPEIPVIREELQGKEKLNDCVRPRDGSAGRKNSA